MAVHPLAGKPAPKDILADIPRLLGDYTALRPDPENPAQLVSFGTSGHRGSSSSGSFNEDHILAISQAICEHRKAAGISGPKTGSSTCWQMTACGLKTFVTPGVCIMSTMSPFRSTRTSRI